jgi:hypothetical protein
MTKAKMLLRQNKASMKKTKARNIQALAQQLTRRRGHRR